MAYADRNFKALRYTILNENISLIPFMMIDEVYYGHQSTISNTFGCSSEKIINDPKFGKSESLRCVSANNADMDAFSYMTEQSFHQWEKT